MTHKSLAYDWHVLRPWQTNAVLVLIGAGMFALSRQLVIEYHHYAIGYSGVSGYSAILYVLAVWIILSQPINRFTFPIILTVAVACRLIPLFAEPHLSSDVYRYVWDGIVQHAHISPYRYVPGDEHLAFLRAPHQHIFDNINRRDYARTIYPPAAQLFFYLVTFISPTVTCMKIAMVLCEGITMYALVALLQDLGLRREQCLLYAWCPVLFWEIAGAGHLDSAAMAFIALALLARYRRRPIATGIFLAVAVLFKLYPLVLFPALYRRGDWKMPVTLAAVIAFGYAIYSSVGLLVFGFLGGYVQEEGMESGARYFLLVLAQQMPGLRNLSTTIFFIFGAIVFAAISLWAWRRDTAVTKSGALAHCDAAFLVPAFALAAALMFLFSPHYAWYVIWLVPFFALLPNLPILTYLMGFFYLYTTALANPGPKMYRLNKILYAAVFVAFLIHLARQHWPVKFRQTRDRL